MLNCLISVTNPAGEKTCYGYDWITGKISSKTYKSGYSEKYLYDEVGRVILVSGSGGMKKSYTYDAMGRVDSMTDALGNTTRYAYTLNGKFLETQCGWLLYQVVLQ